MKSFYLWFLFCVSFLHSIKGCKDEINCFPDYFKFGVSSPACSMELKGNIATIRNRPETISNVDDSLSCYSYHKYEEDIAILKNLGINFYIFSLSWPQILPKGLNYKINHVAVDYYLKLLNRLEEEGIDAYVTLYHWDLPEYFIYLGDWSNPLMVEYFGDYARLAFELFAKKVKVWFTINGPYYACQLNSLVRHRLNPNYPRGLYEYECGKNILKAHAEAYHIYNEEFRHRFNGNVSIILDVNWYEPLEDTLEDLIAADRQFEYHFGWFASPLINGKYPQVLIKRVAERSKGENFKKSRLPEFTTFEQQRIKGSYDFLGINIYSTFFVRLLPDLPYEDPSFDGDLGVERIQPNINQITSSVFPNETVLFRKTLNWIKENYGNPEMMITGNEFGGSEKLDDTNECVFFKEYLTSALKALSEDEVKILGYAAWSPLEMDHERTIGDFERYGLHYDDTNSPSERVPRKSTICYKNITLNKCPHDCIL